MLKSAFNSHVVGTQIKKKHGKMAHRNLQIP